MECLSFGKTLCSGTYVCCTCMYHKSITKVNMTNMLACCILLVAFPGKFFVFCNLQTYTDMPVMPNACLGFFYCN